MTVEERRRRRFSEEFRKEIVGLIEGGKLTVAEASRLYEVKRDCIKRWLTKYGKKEHPETIRIQSTRDVNRLQELEKENKRLKEVLGTQQMKVVYLEEVVKMAKEELGQDFEKKIKSDY
jgi:transposase-like protein